MILQGFTGRTVDVSEFGVEDVNFFDICHFLSKECRWGSACRQFYSVAEHSLWVGKVTEMLGGRMLDGLVHDMHEAYLKDIPTPLKRHMPAWYEVACKQIDFAIYERLGLSSQGDKVKEADRIVAYIECSRLMCSNHSYLNSMPRPEQKFFDAVGMLDRDMWDMAECLLDYTQREARALGSTWNDWSFSEDV